MSAAAGGAAETRERGRPALKGAGSAEERRTQRRLLSELLCVGLCRGSGGFEKETDPSLRLARLRSGDGACQTGDESLPWPWSSPGL